MEKFMLIFRGSDVYQPDQSPAALKALTNKMMDWVGGLMEAGQHVASEPLKREGKVISADAMNNGPFGDAQDTVGGSTIVQAGDIDEATEIARTCPILDTGASIEIRPILTY